MCLCNLSVNRIDKGECFQSKLRLPTSFFIICALVARALIVYALNAHALNACALDACAMMLALLMSPCLSL